MVIEMSSKEGLIRKLRIHGISEKTIDAINRVNRENFILSQLRDNAYDNVALPILSSQTISQPYTVAFMIDLLELKEGEKVLEIGAGSGYNAAVISKIIGKEGRVYSLEIIEELEQFAKDNLKKENIETVSVIVSDGHEGYEKEAPFDKIIVTAGSEDIPEKLFEQLRDGGIMVIPINSGSGFQTMTKIVKKGNKPIKSEHGLFAFVPFKKK